MICKEWRQHFPVALAYNRFVEREQMACLKLYLFLNNCCLGDCTEFRSLIPLWFECVTTSDREDTKPFGDLPQVAKGQWGASASSCILSSMTAEKSCNGSWHKPTQTIVHRWKTKSLQRKSLESSWPTRDTSRRAFLKNCLSTTFTWSLAYARTWRTRWCIYAIKFYWGKGRWSRR